MKKRHFLMLLLLTTLSVFSLFIGVSEIALMDLLNISSEATQIFIISRVPRLMSVLCVGMSLSVAGVIMQQVVGNKFMSPTTGSTMAWAKLGVLVAIMLFPSATILTKMFISLIFAFAGTLLFIRMLKLIPLKDEIFIPLLGIMLGNVVGAVTTYFAYRYELIQNIASWLQGSFTMVLRGRYEFLYAGIPLLIIAFLYANQFTIASLGDDFSSNLGLNYEKIVNLGLIIAATITSIVVVTIGTIPFIGMIVPNIVSLYRGDNLKENILDISLAGGLIVLIGDMISRMVIYPFEIPISVTIGIFGSGCFIYLLLRRNRHASA